MAISLNEKLRKIREIKGYSQEFVAKKLKTERKVISYMETKQKDIPQETIKQLASLYGVSVDFIKNFDPNNIFNNNFYDQSNGFFNVEKIVIETKESLNTMLQTINKLNEKIISLESKLK